MVVSNAVISRVIWSLARVLFSVTTGLKQNLHEFKRYRQNLNSYLFSCLLFLYNSYMKEVGKGS